MSSNNVSMNLSKKTNTKKAGFIVVIVLIVIIVIFLFYSAYVSYSTYNNNNPYLIDAITDGSSANTFPAKMINPSSDSPFGTEFTYSFWIFLKDTNFISNSRVSCIDPSLLHVFHKGSSDFVPNGGTKDENTQTYYPLLQMPGVWLYPNTNKLNIRFNTYENVVETADVGNIPLNMWVNIIIILIGNSVDIYVNGNLKKRTKLSGVPKINYGDLYTSNWSGFQGYLSRLRYFNRAIEPFVIDQIFSQGPSKDFAPSGQGVYDSSAQLASNYWMTTGYPNSYGAPSYNQNAQTYT
jgi:hypothetical protein